uniref:Uncharacterized protein n=1 Tax=Globodera pallida TaxID=36090 RepID=A0A183CCK0_GLOPA
MSDSRLFLNFEKENFIPILCYAGNRVEQYLNKLEQQSLLNSYAKQLRESELLQQQQRIVQQKRQYYGNFPLVGSVYNRVRPYTAQLPQLQQQQFKPFSAFDLSNSGYTTTTIGNASDGQKESKKRVVDLNDLFYKF